jgi:L,D-transpeptidase ErfK/SrfK
MVLVWAGVCSLGTAQSTLEARLHTLPISIGANTVVTRQPGESWVHIGVREHVGYDHLRRANAGNIATAHRLFIPGRHQVSAMTANGLVVNLPELMDFRWKEGKVVAWYPISIGRITSRWHTPVANLRVVSRQKNPIWYCPTWAGGGKMPSGPRNPLGNRWIGLNSPGYGLHGTDDPTSIGRIVSHGCIRHFPAHIDQLFDITHIGMPVMITYETVTVGVDSGVVYLAVFPDIYARGTNAPRHVRKRLAEFGLNGALTTHALEQRLAQADGIARPVLGSLTKVSVNASPLHTPLGPTDRKGVYYLPIDALADALQAQVTKNVETKSVTLTRGDRHVSFSDKSDSFTALDTHFVPIRRAVEGLGGRVEVERGSIGIVMR